MFAEYQAAPAEPASFTFPITAADARLAYIARSLYLGSGGTLEISGANDYDAQGILPPAVSASADTISIPGHKFVAGDRAMVANSGGGLPAGLSAGTAYYVLVVDASTIQLSASSGGSAIDITTAGTGTHSVFKTTQLLNASAGYHPLCVKRVAAATTAASIVGLS